MTARATIHIGPDDDAVAILDALGKWLRRVEGRSVEIRSTLRGYRCTLHAPLTRGSIVNAHHEWVEDAIADALTIAEENDHAA